MWSHSPGRNGHGSGRLPPQILAFFSQAVLIGTPEQAIERLRPFVVAGCQYFSFSIMGNDLETLHLLTERVIPEVRAAEPVPAAT